MTYHALNLIGEIGHMSQIDVIEAGFSSAHMNGTFREFLLRVTDAKAPTAIEGSRLSDFEDILDAAAKAGIDFQVNRLEGDLPAKVTGRFCSARGHPPFMVEFNAEGEACFTVDQVREALNTVGLGSWISHLKQLAQIDVSPVLTLTPEIRETLVSGIEAAKATTTI